MVLGVQQHIPIMNPLSWLLRRATVGWFLHLKHHLLPFRVDNIVPIIGPRRAPALLLSLEAGLVVVGLTTDWFLVCSFPVSFFFLGAERLEWVNARQRVSHQNHQPLRLHLRIVDGTHSDTLLALQGY